MLEGSLIFSEFLRVRRGGLPVFYNRLESDVLPWSFFRFLLIKVP